MKRSENRKTKRNRSQSKSRWKSRFFPKDEERIEHTEQLRTQDFLNKDEYRLNVNRQTLHNKFCRARMGQSVGWSRHDKVSEEMDKGQINLWVEFSEVGSQNSPT